MLELRSTGADARRPPFSSLAPVMSARLLLIDDDSRLTEMVGDYLRNAGFEVETAGVARRRPRRGCATAAYDALVLDLMLPDGDGLDFMPRAARRRRGRGSCRC